MSRELAERLFDPTFNSCRDDAEFELAWAVQSRLAEVSKGMRRAPPPKDRLTIRRRQAAERDADVRLRDQRERRGEVDHWFEEEDDPILAQVRAETPADVRVDGWTATRRILFLELLEEHGSILAAARVCGMSRRAVYRLLPRAPAFAAAFEAAMSRVTATLADTLFDRALNGHEVPVMHGGDVVATRTVHHDMLGVYLLRVRDPLNYATPGEGERALAGRGLKPLPQRQQAAALPPATSDLCDLVQETPAPTPAPAGLRRSAAGHEDSLDRVAAGNTPAGLDRVAAGNKDSSALERRKNRQPRRSAAAARTAQPPLGGLERAGTESGDRLRSAHRSRRRAVAAVEPDARLEPHEVPNDSDMLGRHESSP